MTEERNGLPELPQSWVWTTLAEVALIILGQSPPSSTYNEDGIGLPFYQGKAEFGDVYPTPRKWCSQPKKIAEKGDVLISVRAPVGPTNICPEKSCIGRGLAAICGLDGIQSRLILYLMRSFENVIAGRGTGTTFNAITGSQLRNFEIPLPPLAEQDRIVAKIEELFTQLDAGVAALEKARAQLRRYRQAVLKAAVEGELTREWREARRGELEPASVLLERILEERRAKWEAEQLAKMRAKGKSPKNDRWKRKYKEPALPDTEGLPELPEGWCYTSLVPLLSMHRPGMKTGPFGSLLKKHEHRAEGVPVLGIENVEPMRFVRGNKIHVTEEKAAQLSAYDVQANDILISRSGTVGQVCVVPEGLGEVRMSTNLMRLVLARDGMLPHFFSLLFNGSPFVLAQVSELCSGSTRDFLNQKILSSVVFPVPPIAEQQRIVSEVERRLSVADEMEKAVEQSLKRAERLRQSILKRAFEGKLVTQDPSDEPAFVLLERIKAEKARREGEGKGRKRSRKQRRLRQLELLTP
jgi:type I restriction enzyme S subunit